MRTCAELADEGKTVVAVMHDIQLAAASCDRIALMHGGSIVAFGPPRDVLTSQLLSDVYEWPIRVLPLEGGELVVMPERALRRESSRV